MPAALDALLGGWTVSGIVQAQSGSHLTAFYSSHCGSGTNCYGSEKADSVDGQDPNSGPRHSRSVVQYSGVSVAAFRDATGRSIFAGRFGNADKGASSVQACGTWTFAAMKEFRLNAQTRFGVNVFVTNLFNHANWGRPDTNVTSVNYGRISSLNTDFPLRRVVLGGRLTF